MKTSGPITYNKLFSRRSLVVAGSAGAVLSAVGFSKWQNLESFFNYKNLDQIKVKSHDLSEVGHRLRIPWVESEYDFSHTEKISILGAGIAGLSCGYFLSKQQSKSFSIYDLGTNSGGNSDYFESDLSRASWGAHYLPVPSAENIPLIQFLKDHKIIVGENQGLPIYDEEYLCHDPQERLLIRGGWQNSLLPDYGLSGVEKDELKRFHDFTKKLKRAKGSDGQWVFDIPVEHSSRDEEYLVLDQESFYDFLIKNNFKSEALHWLCNYSCLDDFGTNHRKTSAWAGLHYFCSRRPDISGADEESILVWPEGNGFLKDKLEKSLAQPVKTQHLIRKITKQNNTFRVYIDSLMDNKKFYLETEQIVYALPRYTYPYVADQDVKNYDQLKYNPWLVAHIKVKKSVLEKMHPLAWDTVRFLEKGLGYVNNNHQGTNPNQDEVLITSYYAFSDDSPKQEREKLRQMDSSQIRNFVLGELEKIHLGISTVITSIDYKILGHAMISPQVNFIWQQRANLLPRIKDGIIFAHSDMSGMSLFEEAFYQGHQAFETLLKDEKKHG